ARGAWCGRWWRWRGGSVLRTEYPVLSTQYWASGEHSARGALCPMYGSRGIANVTPYWVLGTQQGVPSPESVARKSLFGKTQILQLPSPLKRATSWPAHARLRN